ncbi:Glutamine-rich protein 2 [Chelonia mydas]|uniref:Glutamine-rich protein 2 n=1 Tax=Chelonia mydas TaxID=8469 RepID=M7AVI8_CHEMY|nr:Glutamine-rich protein 2 [Chelonia mydas]
MALISLLELADLSIGTPEIGVVNFNALHTLLHAIIRQLNLQDVKTELLDEKPKPPEPVPLQEKETKGQCNASEDFPYADLEKKVIGVAAQVHGMEAKVVGVATQVHGVEAQVHGIGEQVQGLEKQMAALEKLPSGTDLLERTKSGSPNGSAVADMWQMMQMKKKIEANETGISKAMALFQDLLNEVNGVKMANFHMNEGLQNIKEKLDSRNLERRINLYPSPEEMYNMVRWEVLEDCLVTGKDKSPSIFPRDPSGASWSSRDPGRLPWDPSRCFSIAAHITYSRSLSSSSPACNSTGAQAGAPGIQPSFPGTWPSSPGTQVGPPGAPGTQAGYLGTPAGASALQPTSPTAGPSALAAQLAIPPGPYSAVTSPASPLQEKDKRLTSSTLRESSGSSSASSRYSDTVEALRQIGQLTDLYTTLKEQINYLEQFKCSHADLNKLRQFLSDAGRDFPISQCLHHILLGGGNAGSFLGMAPQVRKLQNVLEAEVATEADQKVEESSQINLQLGYLRSTMHDIEKELQDLREQQDHGKAKLEQSVTDTALYLQEQDEELLSRIQNTILQVQGDCENLNATTGNLIEDHRQKQKDIALLFQSLEKLEKEKADKEHLETEIDVKADKIALAGKGSCTQFDATMEQLNKMMQDLVNKMSGQEQDWHKVLDKILMEMDSKKADKIALAGKGSCTQFDATMEQLNKMMQDLVNKMSGQEQDWHKVLDKILMEMDSKKTDGSFPLHFLRQTSENGGARPVGLVGSRCSWSLEFLRGNNMPPPASTYTGFTLLCALAWTIMTVPSVPGLPSHRSIRPYTVYELEQVRQHTRSLKLGLSPYPRLDALQLEKSAGLGKLRSIHSKMLMDIEKVQIHFGGSAKASSQMIREIMQSQCLSPDQYNKRDKMAEMAEYGYLSMPRRCGGRPTPPSPLTRLNPAAAKTLQALHTAAANRPVCAGASRGDCHADSDEGALRACCGRGRMYSGENASASSVESQLVPWLPTARPAQAALADVGERVREQIRNTAVTGSWDPTAPVWPKLEKRQTPRCIPEMLVLLARGILLASSQSMSPVGCVYTKKHQGFNPGSQLDSGSDLPHLCRHKMWNILLGSLSDDTGSPLGFAGLLKAFSVQARGLHRDVLFISVSL